MSLFVLALFLLQESPQVEPGKILSQAQREQSTGNRTKAVTLYQQFLEAPKPTDPEAIKVYAYQFSEAQFQKAVCLEAEGKSGEALAAYQSAEKCPRGSFCGNANSGFMAASQLRQGRCLEALGRHEEAVVAYFKATQDFLNGVNSTPVWRIVDLYQAAGRLDSLKKILDQRDQEYLSHFDIEAKKNRQSIDQMNPSLPIRRLMEVRESARLELWQKLVETLNVPGSLYPGGRMHQSPEVADAAHLLAARPEKAVPLLKAKLDANPDRQSWMYYALGLCGSPEAVKILKQRVEALSRQSWEEQRHWDITDLCYALDLSELGRGVLAEFSSLGDDNLKYALSKVYKKSVSLNFRSSEFPPIPKDLRLN